MVSSLARLPHRTGFAPPQRACIRACASPLAMAAGVTNRLWDMTDVAALIAAHDAPVAKRGPYKKKAA